MSMLYIKCMTSTVKSTLSYKRKHQRI